jgi:hypothetical protein
VVVMDVDERLKALKELLERMRAIDREIAKVESTLNEMGMHVTCWITNADLRLSPAQLDDAKEAIREHRPEGAESDLPIQIGSSEVRFQLGFCKINERWCLAVRAGNGQSFGVEPPIQLLDAPYWARAKAVGKMDQLVSSITKVVRAIGVQVSEIQP